VAFFQKDDLKTLYQESKSEAHAWRSDYPAFERLANNDLMDGLDENLPEVNDGTLAASLFKLPKRIVSSKLTGTIKTVDRDEAWLSELASLQWRNEIIPNANSQAPFHRKWKDAVRKAAIYGSVPLITLPVERDGKYTVDFIVADPQDVSLEAGKVSDYDSDIMFWDVYYTELQVKNMIEQAKGETKDGETDPEAYNRWDIPALEEILSAKQKENRDQADRRGDEKPKPQGFKFCISVQRGVNAPFFMYHSGSDKAVREWTNPDPTGDLPIHYLYCYQDFKNPYGIGIVKLAGGTQNVLDYMRQADVLATQIGIRPPVAIEGNEEQVDVESIVYAQDAVWFTGGAKVVRQEMANGVYQELPNRMAMYKTSLNQLIPTGDTSITASAGDPQYSKTPAGVKFQQAALSIDDEDFKDNLYVTYGAVAKSMINTHFANMEGKDLVRLSDDERQILTEAGLEFPQGPDGQVSNQLEVQWDTVRAKFEFEVDPSSGVITNDQAQYEALQNALGLMTPEAIYYMSQDGYKFNSGEAYRSMFAKLNLENLNDIITKMSDEEKQQAASQPFPSHDNIDLTRIYADPKTGPNVVAQIQQKAGLEPDVAEPQQEVAAPTGPTPEELALKQQELDLKQQGVDQKDGRDWPQSPRPAPRAADGHGTRTQHA
jgi:hypothetical protein